MSEAALAKVDWQRADRRRFKERHGYSTTAHYATKGMRGAILERDGYRCVKCGMTDLEHKEKWERPITVDHKDRNRKNNDPSNLQTLCLQCHGSKDLLPRLKTPKVATHKDAILTARRRGVPYQQIADHLGFSIASIWKWCRIWGSQIDLRRPRNAER